MIANGFGIAVAMEFILSWALHNSQNFVGKRVGALCQTPESGATAVVEVE
jgi:hypothetical protein